MVASPTVSDATRQVPLKKSPGKRDTRPKTFEAQMPPPPAKNDIPFGNGISQLKCFRSKRPTTGPGENIVSSIERRKIRGEAVDVDFFFCLSINVHFSIY